MLLIIVNTILILHLIQTLPLARMFQIVYSGYLFNAIQFRAVFVIFNNLTRITRILDVKEIERHFKLYHMRTSIYIIWTELTSKIVVINNFSFLITIAALRSKFQGWFESLFNRNILTKYYFVP